MPWISFISFSNSVFFIPSSLVYYITVNMAALRGLLHIPRTAIREIKLSSTSASDSVTCSASRNLSERIRSTTPAATQSNINPKQNSVFATPSNVWDLQTASYHTCGVAASRSHLRLDDSNSSHGRALLCPDVASYELNPSSTRFVSTQPPEKPKSFMEGVFSNMKEEFRCDA